MDNELLVYIIKQLPVLGVLWFAYQGIVKVQKDTIESSKTQAIEVAKTVAREIVAELRSSDEKAEAQQLDILNFLKDFCERIEPLTRVDSQLIKEVHKIAEDNNTMNSQVLSILKEKLIIGPKKTR
jgi:hypothetical protein